MNTAIVALGLNGLATTGALVYVVRRVSPWPKPPAPSVPRTPVRTTADKAPANEPVPAASGT